MRDTLRYFKGSLWVSAVGLTLGTGLGYVSTGTVAGALQTLFIVFVLSVLEVSISFDNAIVNATVLREMNAVWRHRFLTWGIAIAVFGMRLVFPLLVVCIVAKVGPVEALRLAALEPQEYARVLTSAHIVIASFGGAFLAMVALKYFFDAKKDVHWIYVIEQPLSVLGRIEAVELGIVMVGLYGVSKLLPGHEQLEFIVSGMFGLLVFIAVDGVAALMEVSEETVAGGHRASAALFLYLEVLDASFSFDGVIGAFALTKNLFVIAVGLGVGAMFVRSLTVMFVDEGTLTTYRYLEHGAFYAIGALATIMFAGTLVHIPEAFTGLIGAAFIGLSLWSSVRYNRAASGAQQT